MTDLSKTKLKANGIQKKLLVSFFCFAFLTYQSIAQTYNLSSNLGTITTCSGTFSDGGGNYSSNSNYTVTFCSGSAANVSVSFSSFNLEDGYDHLLVYDGPSTASPLIDNATGNLGAFIEQSSGSCITFQFTSDGSFNYSGWTAAITCVTPCVTPTAAGTITNQTTPVLVCTGEAINFSGAASTAAGGFSISSYLWDFDDGTTGTGVTTSHSYPTPGQYTVNLDVTDNNGCHNTNHIDLVIKVSTTPSFAGTTANQTVCAGVNVCLTGVVTPTTWTDTPATTVAGTTALPDGSGTCYDAPLTFSEFAAGQTITSASQIQSIFANMEHTWAGDLTITIICPNGQQVGLFNSDGTWNTTNISSENFGTPPTGATYTWTSTGTTIDGWGAANPGATSTTSIPAGTYGSEQPYSNLVGCPLNGTWTLKICDTHSIDDGTVFSWGLNFDPSVFGTLPTFTPSFNTNCAGTYWAGANPASTSAITSTSANCDQICVTPPSAGTYTYNYIGVDNFGCTYSTTTTVTATAAPVSNAGADISRCSGISGSIGAAAVGGNTYSWSPTTGLSSSTSANPTFTLTNVTSSPVTTTYTVTTTNTASGCSSTDAVNVTINPQPTSTFTQSANQCLTGNSFTFTNTGSSTGCTYSWNFGGGGASPATSTTNNQTVTYTTAGTYTITHIVTASGGCTSTTTSTVTIYPQPVVTVTPSFSICAGMGTANNLTAAGASTYSWAPSTGLSATTGATVTGNPAATTTYTVTGTSVNGCTATATVTITVNPLPTITVPPITICAGIGGTLTASGASTYSWAPSTGLSATTGASVTANPAGTTTYTVTGTSAAGCVNTATVVVTVNPLPTITVPPITICAGIAGTLNASGASTYTWAPATGLSATTGASVSANPASTTTYTVTGTSAAGCVNTTTVVVTVSPALAISVSPISICAGLSGTLTASGGTTYTWAPATGLSATTGTSVTASPAATTTYTVTGTTGSCNGTTTVTVTVNPLPTTAAAPITICAGVPGTLTASGASTYSWAPSTGLSATTGTSVTANPAATTTYTVTGTSAAGCVKTATVVVTVNPLPTISCAPITICAGLSGTLTASGASTYSWAPATGLSATTGTSVTANPAATTTYTITGTSAAGCVNTTTVIVTVNPLPTITVSPITICTGVAGTLTASGANTYSWSPATGLSATTGATVTANPASTTTYTVTGTAATGCINTATVVVTVTPPATLSIAKVNVSCFGGSNGSATVTPVGGTTPYTYSWAPSGGTAATASGLTFGTYTVTVTTNNGCISTTTANITQPAGMTLTMSSVNATCGTANGQASVSVTGGSPGYTYSWAASGGTAATATSLTAGSYTVTVTDLNGCVSTNSVAVNNSLSPSATTTVVSNVSCFGGNNGSASVAISGGSSPYTQVWSPSGGTGLTASGLTAGTYTVTVTDFVGCVVTANVIITEPPVLTATTAKTDVTCFGGSTGTATVTAGGGTPIYTYSWAPSGGTGTTATGLTAGTYTVTVTDSKGCIKTATATIAEPTVITGTTSNTPVSCFGGTNGTASVVAGGGMPGYTYSWAASGGTNATATGLTTGTYTVTITDLNGCIKTATTTIAQPALLSVSSTHLNSSCGFANGSATATPSGGTGSYTYSWAPSGGTSATASGLAAATYTVTVTDGNGCTATSTTTVNDLSGLVASITAQTNVSCFGGTNGSVTVTASGSTGPYTYSIDAGATYMGSGTFGTLAAGSYTIIAKDANGCTVSVPVTIIQPSALTGAITAQTNVLCNGANSGSVTVAGSGGTSPYTYSSNGVTYGASGTFSTLLAGTYTITVKDNNGCTVNVPVTITQPTALTAAISSQTDNVCFGGNTGSVTIAGSGGTSTYTYSLNGAPSQSSGTFTGLTQGTYTVTVNDANGCITTVPVTITQPTQVTVSATKADASCGAANGSITATGANGTPTYTYSINGTTFQASSTFNSLVAATYTVTVKDANGCTNTTTITINDLSGLVAPETHINVSCNGGSNGSITVTAGGSSSPYTYSIDGGITFQSGGTFSGLSQGSYTIIAKDGNGCTVSVPVTITQPPILTGTLVSQTDINCFGGTGSATVSASGGTTTYLYSIDGGTFGASPTFNGLAVGAHTITIQDANNCTTTVAVTITQPAALALTTSSANATCTAANGSATVTATGGTTNYSYLWTPGGAITATAGNITAGNYSVLVTDAHGCTQTASVSVGANTGASATISSSANVTCIGAMDGTATVSMGAGSIPPFNYAWSPSPGGGQGTATATGLSPGIYNVTVTDGYGCVGTTSVTITEPTQLSFSFITAPVKCFGGADGMATINPSGGTPGYTYLWSPGGFTTQAISNLTVGTYTCVFTDANGCSKTATTTITQPLGMSLSETHIDANCSQSNGSATISVTGGTGPYTYLWSDPGAQTTITATGLAANTYAVTVNDANMCSQVLSVTINNLSGPVATIFSSNNVSCFGNNDGSATAVVTGGDNPYMFSWSNGQALPTATNLTAGTYTLTATDMSGCISTVSVSITEPNALNTTYTFTDPTCFGLADGTITTASTGGTAPYSYLWTPGGATTSSVTGLSAGTYFVTVTDAHSCTSTSTIALTNPAQVTATATATNVTCSGLCNGTATANPVVGNGPFTYLWNDPNVQTTAMASGLCGGSYTVTVTDANGCAATAFANITSPNSLIVNITATGNVSCFGACDGFAQAAVTGGSAPYSYLWMPGNTAGGSVNNLCAATYTVTATDANGCSASTTATITQPAALTASIVSTDITCYNSCDGGATAVYQGGTGPYTFQWTPSLLTTPTIANICAGVQNLAVSDGNGCTAIASVVMVEPTILAVSTTTTNSNCGSADGSACAQITGGSPPFIYAWNDPMTQAVSCANNLNAGVYTISVTDSHGCSITNVANVNDNAAPIVTIPTSTDVTCFGAANGNAQASITGGILPYSIDWNPGVQNTAFVTNLSGGIYSIIVTDSVGCVGTNSVTINEPAVLVSGITASTNVSCTLSCDGSATVAAGGGTAPYTYLWNDATTQTTATATGLCAQQYNVNVTDANGCTSSSIATIGQPSPIVIQLVSATNVSCYGGNNGQITTSVTGGTPGYTYSWTPNVGSSAQVTNLVAGSYVLLVTDANGCTKTLMVDIQEPNAILITTNIVSSTCSLNNGAASVTVSGGISPYTYFWSPTGSPSPVISLLGAGTYSVTVTDDHGCNVDTTVIIQDIAGPTIGSITFTEPLCNGTSLGSATVVPVGGQPLYTYAWSGVGSQTTQTATALPAGTYQVIVSDANHCDVIGIVTITEPAPLVVVPSPRDTICIGQLAQIYGAGYGGTPAYTYTYNPAMVPPGPPYTVSPVTTTIYNVYVTDANNCISPPQTITIFVRDSVRVTASDTVVCNGNSVPISATATGGTGGPYTYSWSNGINTQSQNVSPTINQSPSSYIVMVSDGCSPSGYDTSTVIVYPLAVSFMSVIDTAGCEDFTVQFTALSNIGTSYSWNFGDGTASQSGTIVTHTYVTPNSYNVSLTVTTAQGCVSTITNNQYIDVYPSPVAAFASNPNQATTTAPLISFIDQSTGANTWAWDFGVPYFGNDTSTTQNPSYTYADTGTYSVQLIVTNNYGCSDTISQPVYIIPEYVLYAPNAFTPFNHDGLNDYFMPQGVGIDPNNFEMWIFDRWGNLIYKTNDINKGWDGKANGGNKIAQADTYVWKIVTKDYRGDNHQYIGRITLAR